MRKLARLAACQGGPGEQRQVKVLDQSPAAGQRRAVHRRVDPFEPRARLAQRIDQQERCALRAREMGLRGEQPADREPDVDRPERPLGLEQPDGIGDDLRAPIASGAPNGLSFWPRKFHSSVPWPSRAEPGRSPRPSSRLRRPAR